MPRFQVHQARYRLSNTSTRGEIPFAANERPCKPTGLRCLDKARVTDLRLHNLCTMARPFRTWLVGIVVLVGFGLATLMAAGYLLAHRFDSYVQQQAILYLQREFQAEVELKSLRLRLPRISSLKLLFNGGRGIVANVEGEGAVVRYRGRYDVPPLFIIRKFNAEIDLGSLFNTPKTVRSVTIDGIEINIPPKGSPLDADNVVRSERASDVIVREVIVTAGSLSIFPEAESSSPIRFDVHRVRLESLGKGAGMKYETALGNAHGEILSHGTFGPWTANQPGDTPIAGEYDYKKADLGLFPGIGDELASSVQFQGSLSSINVKEQNVLTAGNPSLSNETTD